MSILVLAIAKIILHSSLYAVTFTEIKILNSVECPTVEILPENDGSKRLIGGIFGGFVVIFIGTALVITGICLLFRAKRIRKKEIW